jgi:hypothetical protein
MRHKVEEKGRKNEEEGGKGWRWRTSCSVLFGVAVGEGDVFVVSSHEKKMEEQEQWAREEEEQTMRHEVERRDAKSRVREVWDGNGEPCAQRCWDWG